MTSFYQNFHIQIRNRIECQFPMAKDTCSETGALYFQPHLRSVSLQVLRILLTVQVSRYPSLPVWPLACEGLTRPDRHTVEESRARIG